MRWREVMNALTVAVFCLSFLAACGGGGGGGDGGQTGSSECVWGDSDWNDCNWAD